MPAGDFIRWIGARLPRGASWSAIVAVTFAAIWSGIAWAQPAPRPESLRIAAVEVQGSLPGFSTEALTSYVARQMDSAHLSGWQFEPVTTSAGGNRVVWRFKLLPYAGGSVRYIGPAIAGVEHLFGVRRAIGVDAKLYLHGQYDTATFDQATIKGGPNDPDLAAVILRITRALVADSDAMARSSSRGLGTPVRATLP
jgi:hypothetical protein